ncbi:MAG: FmdB family zinc ribbon protein [Acidimicrobiales bacterium]
MPIYEFRCSQCDTRFEARRAAELSDATPPPCPNGHPDVRRLLSVFATAGKAVGRSDAAPQRGGSGCGSGCACAR